MAPPRHQANKPRPERRISYEWTELDRVTDKAAADTSGKSHVTPYWLVPIDLHDGQGHPAKSFNPGTTYELNVNQSWVRDPYVTRFNTRSDFEWRYADGDLLQAATIRELCLKVCAGGASGYEDPELKKYDETIKAWQVAKSEKEQDWYFGTLMKTLPFLVFEYWGNTHLRAAYIKRGGVKDWAGFDRATVKINSDETWFVRAKKRSKTATAAALGGNAVSLPDDRVIAVNYATDTIYNAIQNLQDDWDAIESERKARMRVVGTFHTIREVLDLTKEGVVEEPIGKGVKAGPAEGECIAAIDRMMPWIDEMMRNTPTTMLTTKHDPKATAGSDTHQCITNAGSVEKIDAQATLAASRAEIWHVLLEDTETADVVTDLLREILDLAAPGPVVIPLGFYGSTPQAKALYAFATAATAGLEALCNLPGSSKDADALYAIHEKVQSKAATAAGDVAGDKPLPVLLSALGRNPLDNVDAVPLALACVELAAGYHLCATAKTGSMAAANEKLTFHLGKFEASEEFERFRKAVAKVADTKVDLYDEHIDDSITEKLESLSKDASDARIALAKKLGRTNEPGPGLIKGVSRVLTIWEIVDGCQKASDDKLNPKVRIVNLASAIDSGAAAIAGTAKDVLRYVGKLDNYSESMKVVGKYIGAAGALVGIATGALEIADYERTGDRKLAIRGAIDVSSGLMALVFVIAGAGGPAGLIVAILAIAATEAVDYAFDHPEEPIMNEFIGSLLEDLKRDPGAGAFLGLLLSNKERGKELDDLMLKLNPNPGWTGGENAKEPEHLWPYFHRIKYSKKVHRKLIALGFESNNIIDAIAPGRVEWAKTHYNDGSPRSS